MYDPGPVFETLTSQIAVHEKYKLTNWLSLTHILWACARLLHPIPEVLKGAGVNLLKESHDDVQWKGGQYVKGPIEAQHLMLCLWSLCVFEDYSSELALALADRVNHVDVLEEMEEEQKQQVSPV